MEEVETEDEVFTENVSYIRTEQRSRHLSDCIDSVGVNFNVHRHSFSEYSGLRKTNMDKSPPGTPDLGYDSPGPSSTFLFKTLWSRHSSNMADEMDAITTSCTSASITYGSTPPSSERKKVASFARMPVDKYAVEYNMNHPRRGRAVILNNDQFCNVNLPDREGSKQDVASLQICFQELGFEVSIHHNLCIEKVKQLIITLSEDDHSDADCFAMIVLTHGMHSNYLWANDYPYDAEILWTSFAANKCLSLAGKPKLFFIQACRGERLDPGIHLVSQTQIDSGVSAYKIPNHADFLIAFSTTTGMYSFRNAEKGTWFIQSLCKELNEYGTKEDMLRIMTRVLRTVALDYESYNMENPLQHGQKQVPALHSMLIRDIYFRPKNSISTD